MSGLIDMWTNKVSKLKEKGHGSIHMEPAQQQQQQQEKMSSVGFAVAVGKFNHLNKPRLLCSEDSVSLLVTCFSP